MANRRRAAGSAVVALALASATAGLTGCAGSSSSSTGASATVAPNGAVGVGRAAVGPTPGRTAAPHAGELQAVAVRLPSAVIKTAAVRLRVAHDRIQATVTRIAGVADRLGGVISSSTVVKAGQPVGTIVVRVPSDRFQTALVAVENAGVVRSATVQGHDVSQEFVDLNARLVNLRTQEQVLRRLMGRAQTVAGSILVENEQSQVQLQIEEATGQIRYLEDRVSLSTIAMTVTEAGAQPVVHHHASALWNAGRRAVDGAVAVVGAVIVGLGYAIPLAVLAALAFGAFRLLAPRLPGATARGGRSADA